MRRVSILAALIAVAWPQSSPGAVRDSVVVVPQGWIYGACGYPDGCEPTGGDLLFFGLAQHITSPLLESADGAEYTIYIHDAVCTGTGMWDDPYYEVGGAFLLVGPSLMEMYRDDTPDADPANPETYRDGELILHGSVGELWLHFDDYQGHSYPPRPPYRVRSELQFGGGMWFDRVSKDGIGFAGQVSTTSGAYGIPPFSGSQGIVGYFSAAMAIDAPVAVETATWGKLKSLYR